MVSPIEPNGPAVTMVVAGAMTLRSLVGMRTNEMVAERRSGLGLKLPAVRSWAMSFPPEATQFLRSANRLVNAAEGATLSDSFRTSMSSWLKSKVLILAMRKGVKPAFTIEGSGLVVVVLLSV